MISGRRNRKGIPFSHDFTSFSLFLPTFHSLEVSVSKVYFMADRNLLKRLKKIDCYRIPLSYYLPKELLTPEILEEEKGLKEEGII